MPATESKGGLTVTSDKMEGVLNDQIQAELYSAYLYLSMSAYCESANLPGFAHWMRVQAQEEQGHAMKLYGFVHDRGGRVVLQAIAQPPIEFDSALDVFERVYEHEQKVTGLIHDLYGLALEQKDYASQSHLQWFVDEQVEEEKTASGIVETLKVIGDKPHALIMLDRALAKRGAD
jgi:ferritin